ncbi:MAG TPA: DmsC/YnfH family molybdoenzyme membrane anchor subunit [Syntrophomonadaceae bacterium]|nr:DmsC/YnfH family molybdoenzyme membrane anchor subunit [Syntrophomonadaceae bacterium]
MQVHIALLISTVCQRLGLGLFIFSVLANQFMGVILPIDIIAVISLGLLGFGGLASAFHLGKPTRFFNAFSNFKSHLTQEALVTPFLGIALLVCILDGFLFDLGNGAVMMHWVTVALSLLFLITTGLVYQLSARPAWDTGLVLIIFMLTAAQVGSISTMVAAYVFTSSVSVSLTVVTILMFVLSMFAQYLYIQRLKTLEYGVAVNVISKPYNVTFITWLIFGVLTVAISLIFVAMQWQGAMVLTAFGAIASVIGIFAWTVLFFKTAIKVKMFPMYDVDLNLYF